MWTEGGLDSDFNGCLKTKMCAALAFQGELLRREHFSAFTDHMSCAGVCLTWLPASFGKVVPPPQCPAAAVAMFGWLGLRVRRAA